MVKLVSAFWFTSENWSEVAVLSQGNHAVVVKHNNQFKRDSQRSAFSLLLMAQCLGLDGGVVHPLIGRYA